MTNGNNNFFKITQKNLHSHNDFRTIIPPDSIEMKTHNPYYYIKVGSERNSFVVEWQMLPEENFLPSQEKPGADKPFYQ